MSRALAYAPVALFAVLGWTHRWMADDGFIYLRVVDNLQSGAGPVFAEGERVEAYTSPLWFAILSVSTWVAGLPNTAGSGSVRPSALCIRAAHYAGP